MSGENPPSDEIGHAQESELDSEEAGIEAIKAKIAHEIRERESQIALFHSKQGGVIRVYLEQFGLEGVSRLVELYQMEIGVLSALDPQKTSFEVINAISAAFHCQREALATKT